VGRYDQLRDDRLCSELQVQHPDWPYPLLFHGEECSRDLFLLDPVVEYRVLKLGRNMVQDVEYLAYPLLNDWIHYRFFNGIAPVIRSAESSTLLPRLYRLQHALLDDQPKRTVSEYWNERFGIADADRAFEKILEELGRMTAICRRHAVVVWGVHAESAYRDRHLQEVIFVNSIGWDRILQLPHLRSPGKLDLTGVLKREEKALGHAVARNNRWRKHWRRLPRSQRAGPPTSRGKGGPPISEME